MKKIIALLLTVAATTTSFADIAVFWRAFDGFYNWNAPALPADPGDYINDAGGSAFAYMIYSPSGVITVDENNLAGFLVGGDNVVVQIAGNPATSTAGTPYGNFDFGFNGQISGYGAVGATIWSRIIDLSAPLALYQYFDSNAVAAPAYNIDQPALIDLNGQSGTGGIIGDRMIAVVPEPSVLAFLAIGGIALAVRRRIVA